MPVQLGAPSPTRPKPAGGRFEGRADGQGGRGQHHGVAGEEPLTQLPGDD